MTSLSYFFAELSEDNRHIACLLTSEMRDFMGQLKQIVSSDNCDFVVHMVLFYFNALV